MDQLSIPKLIKASHPLKASILPEKYRCFIPQLILNGHELVSDAQNDLLTCINYQKTKQFNKKDLPLLVLTYPELLSSLKLPERDLRSLLDRYVDITGEDLRNKVNNEDTIVDTCLRLQDYSYLAAYLKKLLHDKIEIGEETQRKLKKLLMLEDFEEWEDIFIVLNKVMKTEDLESKAEKKITSLDKLFCISGSEKFLYKMFAKLLSPKSVVTAHKKYNPNTMLLFQIFLEENRELSLRFDGKALINADTKTSDLLEGDLINDSQFELLKSTVIYIENSKLLSSKINVVSNYCIYILYVNYTYLSNITKPEIFAKIQQEFPEELLFSLPLSQVQNYLDTFAGDESRRNVIISFELYLNSLLPGFMNFRTDGTILNRIESVVKSSDVKKVIENPYLLFDYKLDLKLLSFLLDYQKVNLLKKGFLNNTTNVMQTYDVSILILESLCVQTLIDRVPLPVKKSGSDMDVDKDIDYNEVFVFIEDRLSRDKRIGKLLLYQGFGLDKIEFILDNVRDFGQSLLYAKECLNISKPPFAVYFYSYLLRNYVDVNEVVSVIKEKLKGMDFESVKKPVTWLVNFGVQEFINILEAKRIHIPEINLEIDGLVSNATMTNLENNLETKRKEAETLNNEITKFCNYLKQLANKK